MSKKNGEGNSKGLFKGEGNQDKKLPVKEMWCVPNNLSLFYYSFSMNVNLIKVVGPVTKYKYVEVPSSLHCSYIGVSGVIRYKASFFKEETEKHYTKDGRHVNIKLYTKKDKIFNIFKSKKDAIIFYLIRLHNMNRQELKNLELMNYQMDIAIKELSIHE